MYSVTLLFPESMSPRPPSSVFRTPDGLWKRGEPTILGAILPSWGNLPYHKVGTGEEIDLLFLISSFTVPISRGDWDLKFPLSML